MDITFIINIATKLDYNNIINLASTNHELHNILSNSWEKLAFMKYDYDLNQVRLLRKFNTITNTYEYHTEYIARRRYRLLDIVISQTINDHYMYDIEFSQRTKYGYIQSDYFWVKILNYILGNKRITRQIMNSFQIFNQNTFVFVMHVIGVIDGIMTLDKPTLRELHDYAKECNDIDTKIFFENIVFKTGTTYLFKQNPLPNELIQLIIEFKNDTMRTLMMYLAKQKMYKYALLIFINFYTDYNAAAVVATVFYDTKAWPIVVAELKRHHKYHIKHHEINEFIATVWIMSNGKDKLIEELKKIIV